MDKKKARNIAVSLILPERVLANEVAASGGRNYPSEQDWAITQDALRAARAAIADTLTQQ